MPPIIIALARSVLAQKEGNMDAQAYLRSTEAETPRALATVLSFPTHLTYPTEVLPFTVRIARSEDALDKAVQIRHAAYARHVPAMAEKLLQIEAADLEPGSIVLVAESKLDGTPVGTMRIHTNSHARLPLEHSVHLPAWLPQLRLAEATRLGVATGRIGRVVKTALFKAYFNYCQATSVDWMVITARAPLDRMYDGLLFDDVFPGGEFIPMAHVGNIPHRIMKFEVDTAERRWEAAEHPLFDYIFRTRHPDIDIRSGALTDVALDVATLTLNAHGV